MNVKAWAHTKHLLVKWQTWLQQPCEMDTATLVKPHNFMSIPQLLSHWWRCLFVIIIKYSRLCWNIWQWARDWPRTEGGLWSRSNHKVSGSCKTPTFHVYPSAHAKSSYIPDALAVYWSSREELFVTSKVFNQHHTPERVLSACRNTLKNLQLSYLVIPHGSTNSTC